MNPLNIVLVLVIILVSYQLFLAITQGRIFGKNNWLSYSAGWIYVSEQPGIFYTTVVAYTIGLLGAIFVLSVNLVR